MGWIHDRRWLVPLKQQWFWLVVIILALVASAVGMVVSGHLPGEDAVKFFSGPIGVFVGYLIGKAKPSGEK